MVKIDIISGFLGAGKTTFIKRLLSTNINKEKVVLIENEFGEISIDSDILSTEGIQIKELSQGCICCSLVGDFSKSLAEVIDKFNPERIIIEPSGVGKLSDVKKAIISAELGDNLNSIVCLVDAVKAKIYHKNFGEFFIDQIQNASTVILSRTDIASNEKISDAIKIVRELNENCVLVTTPIATLNDDELFKSYEGIKDDFIAELLEAHENHHDHECCCHEHENHHDHECCCHEHEEHHDHECCCHEHEEHHDHECCCHEHEEHHDHECCCHEHEEHHDHECCCHEHEEHHDHECCCHEHEEHHDHECCCHEHEEHHDHECCCHEHEDHHEHECCCHEHHHDAAEIFQSFGIETAEIYDIEKINILLNSLANTDECGLIVRAKGIVNTKEGWIEFNITPDELHVVESHPISMGKICVIGVGLKTDFLKSLL